jgi:hypothetical protein
LKHCASCGTELSDKARYCRQCGQKLSTQKSLDEATMKHSALSISARSSNELPTRITRPLPAPLEQGQETSSVATLEAPTQDPQLDQPSNGTTSVEAENTGVPTILADLPNTDPPVEDEQPFNGNMPAMETGSQADSQVSELPTSTLAEIGQPGDSQNSVDEQESAVVAEAESQLAPPPDPLTPLPASPPPQPASARTAQGRRGPGARSLVIGLVCLLLIAAGAGAYVVLLHPFSQGNADTPGITSNFPSDNSTTPGSGVTVCPGSASGSCLTPSSVNSSKVNLTFAGTVTGQMTVTTVVSCGAEPATIGGQQYHLSVLGTVNRQPYGFAFAVYPYSSASAYTSGVSSFFGPAGSNSSLTQWRSSTSNGVNVTINSDMKSGTLDINLTSVNDQSTVHATGSWTCA